jgi:hypothetical protein
MCGRRRSELEARRTAPPRFTSLATMIKLQNLTHTSRLGTINRGGAQFVVPPSGGSERVGRLKAEP